MDWRMAVGDENTPLGSKAEGWKHWNSDKLDSVSDNLLHDSGHERMIYW